MNNNFYQWHDDVMVHLEMREVQKLTDQNRILKEAGILGDGWLLHVVKTLAKWIAAVRSQKDDAIEVQAHSWKRDSLV